MKKMKLNIQTIIVSAIINLAMIALINGVDAKTIEKEIVEIPVETTSASAETKIHAHDQEIIATYKKGVHNEIIVEFSDYSWAIIDDKNEEYIFQPACMGDWDMTFDNAEHLKMAMETYYQDAKVVVEEPEQIKQTEETAILNPEKIIPIEKELQKLPVAVLKLLVENDVTISVVDYLGDDYQEDVYTNGLYYWDSNKIHMNDTESSIEYALIHEIGHALDDIFNINTEKIVESYENKEIKYDNDHYYSEIREYVAQGVAEYYNGTMKKDTTMYKELDKILGGYR